MRNSLKPTAVASGSEPSSEEAARVGLCPPACDAAHRADKRSAKIYIGSMPPKTSDNEFDAPFILAQAISGHDDSDYFAHEAVALRLAVWNEDPEGAENDLHNLIAIVRRAIMPARSQALSGRYILCANEKGEFAPWARPDEQAQHFAEAYILTNWKFKGIEGV